MVIAGPMISLDVIARGLPRWANKSPQKSVCVVSSNIAASIPAMWDMRRVDITEALATDIDNLSIREDARWSISHIGDRSA